MRRSALLPALALLLLTGCTAETDGTPTNISGALIRLDQDVDLGFAFTGAGRMVITSVLDSTGTPVTVLRPESGYTPDLLRGTDVATATSLQAFGEHGGVAAMAIAPDDTVVFLGQAEDAEGRVSDAVVRIAPDDTATVLPLTGAGAQDIHPSTLEPVDFSTDAGVAVVAREVTDSSQGYPIDTGEVAVDVVDTRTGALTASQRVRLAEPRADVPGEFESLYLRDVALAPDGSVVLAYDVLAEGGLEQRLQQLGPDLAPSADTVFLEQETHADDALPRFVDVDDAGIAYATSVRPTDDFDGDLRVVAVEPGSAAVREVAVFPGVRLSAGLAVAPDGSWAYLTGMTDTQLGQKLTAVDLRTGAVAPETGLCRQGFVGAPLLGPDGTTLLVPGRCSDVTTNQEHLYLLTT